MASKSNVKSKAKTNAKNKTSAKTSHEHSLLTIPAPMQKRIDAILDKVEKSESGLMDLSKVALRVLKRATEISQGLKTKVVDRADQLTSLKSKSAKPKAPKKKVSKKGSK